MRRPHRRDYTLYFGSIQQIRSVRRAACKLNGPHIHSMNFEPALQQIWHSATTDKPASAGEQKPLHQAHGLIWKF
jgi:hypothetical protein